MLLCSCSSRTLRMPLLLCLLLYSRAPFSRTSTIFTCPCLMYSSCSHLANKICQMDENMNRASIRNAACSQKFYVRSIGTDIPYNTPCTPDETIEMTLSEIMNGSQRFVGLVPVVDAYITQQRPDAATRTALDKYLSLIRRRASGTTINEWCGMTRH